MTNTRPWTISRWGLLSHHRALATSRLVSETATPKEGSLSQVTLCLGRIKINSVDLDNNNLSNKTSLEVLDSNLSNKTNLTHSETSLNSSNNTEVFNNSNPSLADSNKPSSRLLEVHLTSSLSKTNNNSATSSQPKTIRLRFSKTALLI